MPFTLSISAAGEEVISLALQRGADSLSNIEKYWPAVADVFYEIEAEQFRTEGARGGEPWAPLSAAYLKMRQSTGWPSLRANWRETQPILARTGALVRSLTTREGVSGLFGGEIYLPTPDSLTLGSSLPYAMAHQRGYAARNLPARPPINLRPEDGQKFRRAFRDEIAKVVTRAGWSADDSGIEGDFWQGLAGVGSAIEEDMSMF